MYIVDHENLGSNETGTIRFRPSNIPFNAVGCVGNEVRGEVVVSHNRNAQGGWRQVKITGLLYEGETCNTNDLDGTGVRFVWLPPNRETAQTFRVRNTAEGDSDYIDFHLVMRN